MSVDAQSNPLRIRKTIVGNLTTVETGQVFQYRITASCNNLTTTCGDLTLTDTLPAGVTLLGVSGPVEALPAAAVGIKYVYDDPAGPTVIIRNKRPPEVGAGEFTDGEIVEFLMTVRVDNNATPGTLNNNLTGDVTQQDGGTNPNPVTITPVPVTLLPPDPPAPNGSDWTYDKIQVIPVPPQQPTTGQPTLYQITVCPVTNIGKTPYTGMTITDTYPTGATVLDADGGTVTPPQVVWNIPDAEVAAALQNNTCIERQLLLSYNPPAFTGPIANQSNSVVVDAAECTTVCGNDSVNFDIVTGNVQVTTTKSTSGSPVGEGGIGRFFLNVSPNQGNIPAPNLVLSEDINNEPGELIRVTQIQSGRWEVLDALQPYVTVRARVEYDSSAGGTTVLGTANGLTNTVWTTFPAPPAYVDAVRWVFEYDPDGSGPATWQPGLPLGFTMLEAPEVVFTPMTNPPFPTGYTAGIYQNCATTTYTGGAGTTSNCINYELGDPGITGTNIETSKSSPGNQTEFAPLEEFPLELRLRLSERAQVGDTIINPSIIDTLPPQLEFVSWDSVTFVNVPGGPHPIPFFRQTGQNLQWYWENAPLPGSLQPAPAGLPNTQAASGSRAFTMTANGQDQDVIVRFTVRIAPTVDDNVNAPTPYTNNGYFIGPDTPVCENGTLGTESSFGLDDGDGVNELVCQTTFGFRVRRALALEGFKWIRNGNYAATPPRFPEFAIYTDNTVGYDTSSATTGQSCTDAINYFVFGGVAWTRFPCVAFGFPESPAPTNPFTAAAPNDDQFEYLLDVRNSGNVAGQDYYLYDMLPRIGDTGSGGPLSETPRLSRFATYLTGPITPVFASFVGVTNAANIIVEYSQAANPCRTQVFDDPPQGGCTNDWSPTFPTATPRAVTAYRIRFAANMQIAVGGRMIFRVPMVIAYDAQYGDGQIAWNSFAHTAINAENVADGFLPPAEPRKVGIRVPERLSIGNRVWRDSDNSGTINAPDDLAPGIPGVVVNLYADFDGNSIPDGPAIDTDTTDANGYYLFDDIIPDANPNNNRYLVGIPASNFDNVGDPLYGLRSSSGPTNAYVTPPEGTTDSDDNGFDEVPYVPPSIEVLSATINLVLYNEPITETDLSGNPTDGAFSRGTRGEANFNSDLTIDFGFFGGGDSPLSIGNRVFYDDGSDGVGGFNAAQRNNGLQDANERGVNGVRVELYRDGNGNNQPDANELIKFDITTAGSPGGGRPGTNLDGYYLFDNLDAGTYFVVIPASEFGTGDPLGGWHSSSFNGTETIGATGAVGTPATDLDDNGIEPTSRRPDLNGVRSGPIVLIRVNPGDPGLEVTGETDLSLQPDPGTPNSGDPLADPQTGGIFGPTVWDGPGSIGRWTLGVMTDDNSNVAVDFGFIPPMSLGNRVWLDDSTDPAQWAAGGSRNNGLIDATDDGNLITAGIQNPGIPGVDVQLYFDENANGVIDAGDTLVATTVTAANGYYLFDGLAPGNYVVRIPSTEFGTGQPLNGLISSFDAVAQVTPTDQTDSNDNGIDNAAPATNGIASSQIQLVYLSESTTEGDIAPAGNATTLPGPQSRGRFGEADNDSDLTIDFGFVRPPMSIGNRVWNDDHPTNPALRNNAVFNGGAGGEVPIANVEVALYRDLDADGNVDPGEDTGLRDTTDANGFYLFSNLAAGDYIVAITAANFNTGGPLENMISSSSVAPNPVAADNATDNNDNGRDAFFAGVGIISSRINLTVGVEAINENPLSGNPADGPSSRGTNGEADNNSNLTVDFGFYTPMSLGNRVWLDDTNTTTNWNTTRNNAVIDFAADDLDNPNIGGVQGLGVAGVTLRLYRDLDADGVIDVGEDTGRTTTTNANGYYLFDGLTRGNYIVGVEASNFNAGQPLFGFYSSTNATAPTDNDTDNTDDGRGSAADPNAPDPTFGVISPSIVLSYTNATVGLEPLAAAEPDPTPQTQANRGVNNERDDFSNLTIDFGFVRPPMSIGNQVWLDDHPTDQTLRNNGIFNGGAGGETAIAGVEVALYRDTNTNGVIDTGEDTGFRDTTDANGFYLFSNLVPGTYIVAITETNFNTGGPLENMISSRNGGANPPAADNQTDNNDNGLDTPVTGVGIVSSPIVLAVGTEPTAETPINAPGDGPNGRGVNGEADANSDLTVDFGFYTPMSLGNRVWLDDTNTTANWNTTRNNAVIDFAADDLDNPNIGGVQGLGVAGVTLRLYRDSNTNGVIDVGEDTGRTTTTNANGYYLFDGLTRGNYIVGVEASNFNAGQPLFGFYSSTNATAPTDNDTDNTDDGIGSAADPNAPDPTFGVISPSIALTYTSPTAGDEPLAAAEPDPTPQTQANRGVNNERDDFSNLTIDFGFVRPPMSIGNQVWLDDHPTDQTLRNNGVFNGGAGGETAIAGVEVALYRDANGNGVVDAGEDTGLRDTTDANGFYLFSNLIPGDYIVAITAANFNTGGPLENMISSRNGGANPPAADDQTDNNDNGLDPFVAGIGVISSRITLAVGTESTAETPTNAPGDGPNGRGVNGEADANSDLTVDFGFYTPMSLGNRVWLDDTNNPANLSFRNNAILNPTNDDLDNPNIAGVQGLGVAGVTLRLYRDLDADGVIDVGEDTGRTTTTNANGYYLFDGLTRGNYIVGVEASNFNAGQPLFGFFSSFNTAAPTDNDTDNTDDGRGSVADAEAPDPTFGVISPSILLSYTSPTAGLEPLEGIEPDPTPQTQANRGANGERDAFSNLTIDFGFTRRPMSIGNQVWLDDHPTNPALRNNGIFDGGAGGETPIAGVEVALYRDDNANGVVDPGEDTGERDITDANGFYLFDDLPVGDYIIAITEANFAAGGPLENMISSRSAAPNPLAADNQTDNNDNGLDALVPGVGIISSRINLALGAEPLGENPVNDPADGPGGRGQRNEADENSDLTVDFGFYTPMSLGNRVWLDDTNTTANWNTTRNNAVIDLAADDLDNPNIGGVQGLGVAGVTLRLYRDLNNNGVIDGGEDTGRTTTTNANGYYLFDGLARGNYIVGVEASNFAAGAPLFGFYSSTNAALPTDNNTDNTDDGIGQTANPTVPDPTFGVISPSIALTYTSPTAGDEPLQGTETDPATQAQADRGANGERDAFSNLTVDFGFTRPPMSIGNQVWNDTHPTTPALSNNGLIDATELPIPGVQVALYRDLNNNGVIDAGEDTGLRDTTDANGYYLFSNLIPGDYIVAVTPANFASGGPLFEMGSSRVPVPADDGVDNNDNGIDNPDPTSAAATNFGVISSTIRLTVNGEVSGETPTNAPADGPNGRGVNGELDANSDLTVDFGFFKALSLGNRVWLDNGAGASYNNGVIDVGEPGIAGVRVELYRDANGNGTFEIGTDTFIGFDTTDGGGFYLFDGLTEGTYFAFIPRDNFTNAGGGDTVAGDPLANYNNSSPVGVTPSENAIDSDDVGINENFPELNGVVSVPFTLTYDTEPTGETNLSGNPADGPFSRGPNNETDRNSNLTVDFGFVGPVFSIGNRIWADINNNRIVDAGDDFDPGTAGDQPGIPGVRVVLYRDNGNSTFNQVGDTVVGADTTDANGFYLFSNLPPGNYFVWIDQTNFRVISGTPRPLFDWYSSSDPAGTPPAGDAGAGVNIDNDDNGIDDLTPDVGGVVSGMFTLSKNDEPIGGPGANDENTTTPPTLNAGLSGAGADGPESRGNNGELDSDSNLTVDFGFYRPLSLGNRVWFDSDSDGIIDFGSETGIPGVLIQLYRDTNGTPGLQVGADTLIGTDTTDANGYYLFDNLPPGNNYYVHIPASNFAVGQPLLGRFSTIDNVGGTLDVDNNDNGVGDSGANPAVDGVSSGVIELIVSYTNPPAAQQQPTNESDLSGNAANDGPNSRGRFGETNGNSDLTIDFGFTGTRMSLGNRVWFDGNNSTQIDPTDDFVSGGAITPGIPGVTVRLFLDADTNGIPDSGIAVVPDVVTDTNGYYLFENLQPGNYVVAIPNSNFATGQPLNGLISSTGNAGDTQIDSDDNGIDVLNPTYGLLSPTVNLALNNEPVAGVEIDVPAVGNGAGINDNNGELTIDFGFYRPMSLGNRLWFDTDADSTQDVGESGVPAGVTLGLYRDDNNDGTPDGPAIDTTTTDANGYYLFDGLGAGRYIVIVEEANFQAGGALENYTSSTGQDASNNLDRNDNGVNNPTPATGGIRSNTITLATNTAPTNETDLGPQGHGTNGETNNNSNLTVDFGFVTSTQLSLGNLVWLDNGGSTPANARNGIRDAGELPFAGVRVNLYRDVDANGIPDDLGAVGPAGDIVATDVTDANGFYLFDNLAPGNYIVELAAANFNAGAVLDGYGSTTTLAADINNNDNGIDTPNTVNGIQSGTITLALNSEPLNDTDTPAPAEGYGAGGVDANGNMTVDFGLYRPMSLGNRVWFDTNADGRINGTENGIAGVTVELRADTDSNGVFDPTVDLLVTTPGVTATDTTDSLGYYLFGNLLPGTYFVYIPPSQFAAGGLLNGFGSTLDNVGGVPADSNDNGVTEGAGGIVSNLITLVENGAPTSETDLSGDAAADGPRFIGLNGENNRNSDLTIDFGFTSTPMSLGNRVWLDNGAGGGGADNGLIDGTEAGIAGVRVNLYADTDSNGTPDGGIIRTVTTDANGYYLFDNLPPGNYLVQIAPSNFNAGQPLRGLFSSTGNDLVNPGNTIGDSNDNGLDAANPSVNGIFSGTITLAPTTEPVGELDPNPQTQADRGANGETDDNSDLTIDFGFSTRSDRGDAPDSYGTTNGAGGPSHVIVSNLFIGSIVDNEPDGQPNATADGDDTNGVGADDEDGVTIPTVVAGTNLNVEVVVFNNTGTTATLVGWVDLDGSGTFDVGEAATVTVPSSATAQTVTLTFVVPSTADIDTGGSTYARFRLTTDPVVTTSTPGGAASDGEVEDYVVPVNPPGVSVTKTDGLNSIVTGQTTTYTITIQYSGLTGITRPVNDTTTPPNAFVPSSLSWTCDANLLASCITGQPLGTDIATDTDAGTPPISGLISGQSVDLTQGGELIYRVTGTLRPDYADVFPGIPNVDNTVTLNVGETATDSNGVIFDPPFGVKTGIAIGGNTIRWTMVWFNTGALQAATITDVLDPNQTNPTNLVCTPFGASSTNLCEVQNGDTIFWDGTLGDGTTLAARNDNRLEITFDVTVAGPGTYNNTGTITTPGGDSSSASNTVTIAGPDGTTDGSTGGSGSSGVVPTIAKAVDPIFSQPGGEVTWTILVINPHNEVINNVMVSDNVPSELQILSTSSSNGTVTVSGQTVSATIPTLNALETVSITVRTRIKKDVKDVSEIRNLADLVMNGVTAQTSEAKVSLITALPATGETPLGWIIVRSLMAGLGVIVGAAVLIRRYRLRMTR